MLIALIVSAWYDYDYDNSIKVAVGGEDLSSYIKFLSSVGREDILPKYDYDNAITRTLMMI